MSPSACGESQVRHAFGVIELNIIKQQTDTPVNAFCFQIFLLVAYGFQHFCTTTIEHESRIPVGNIFV